MIAKLLLLALSRLIVVTLLSPYSTDFRESVMKP